MSEHKKSAILSTHPEYQERIDDWYKFRLIMEGGSAFKAAYLFQKPGEGDDVFELRKNVATTPTFSKSSVKKIRNAIYQRLDGVRRWGGSSKYQAATSGRLGGVDLKGATMEFFMGHKVLPELLAMGKVGYFIDSPNLFGENRTIRDNINKHPYMYVYGAEDIRNWEFYLKDEELQLRRLLLRVRREERDPLYGLVESTTEQYRLFEIDDLNQVWVRFFDKHGSDTDINGSPIPHSMPTQLMTQRIPFVLLELETSLLQDVADHQIALMNMESLDINYAVRANSPYYVEQYDPAFDLAWNRGSSEVDISGETTGDGSVDNGNPTEIALGGSDGRRYPRGLDQPGFIAPPADPMLASMEKQTQLKDDIDRILDLATVSSSSRYASAESKGFDERGLDSGLSAIGLMLENAERQTGIIWNEYEGGKTIDVKYPERYSLKSDEDRRKDAKSLSELANKLPSDTWRKNVYKEMAETMLGAKISDDDLDTIFAELEESKYPTADPEQIRADVETSLVSRETGSLARGWPKGEAEKALEEKAENEQKAAAAQGVNLAARGLENNPEDAALEKDQSQNPDNNPDGKKLVRGKGRKMNE